MNTSGKIIFSILIIVFIAAQYSIIMEYMSKNIDVNDVKFYRTGKKRAQQLLDRYGKYNPEINKTIVNFMFSSYPFSENSVRDASIILNNYIKMNPLDHEAYYLLYRLKSILDPDKKNLVYLLEKGQKLDPLSMTYNLELARLHKKSGDLNSAHNYYKILFSKPGHMERKARSDIYAEMAMLSIDRKDPQSFEEAIEKAKSLHSQNWKIDFALFKNDLIQGRIKNALLYLENSYKNFIYGKNNAFDYFLPILETEIKALIKLKKYEIVKILYDKFSTMSNEHENLLNLISKKFVPYPKLIKNIWGDKIHLTIFNPSLLDKPVLLNEKRACIRTKTERALISAESPFSEYINVSYSNAPGFIDLWYIPLHSKIESDHTSIKMIVTSDQKIGERQIAVELSNNLYYSQGFSEKISENRYALFLKNIHDYAIPELLSEQKGNLVYLNKVGFNTVCRSGKYAIEEIQMYLEDK